MSFLAWLTNSNNFLAVVLQLFGRGKWASVRASKSLNASRVSLCLNTKDNNYTTLELLEIGAPAKSMSSDCPSQCSEVYSVSDSMFSQSLKISDPASSSSTTNRSYMKVSVSNSSSLSVLSCTSSHSNWFISSISCSKVLNSPGKVLSVSWTSSQSSLLVQSFGNCKIHPGCRQTHQADPQL